MSIPRPLVLIITHIFLAPLGMAIIGRQFIACWKMEENPSPRGTADSTRIIADICSRQVHANRPYGDYFLST